MSKNVIAFAVVGDDGSAVAQIGAQCLGLQRVVNGLKQGLKVFILKTATLFK